MLREEFYLSLDFEVLKLGEEETELYNSLRVKLGKGEAFA